MRTTRSISASWSSWSCSSNEELFDWNRRLEDLVAERTEALHRVNQALASKMAEAQRLSEIDPLTELYNRRKVRAVPAP